MTPHTCLYKYENIYMNIKYTFLQFSNIKVILNLKENIH